MHALPTQPRKRLQLVCPAGNLPSLRAAVDGGADAVYIGLRDNTNARAFGGLNFDLDSARVVNRWVRLATYPAGVVAGQVRQTAWDQIKRVIRPQSAVFGETPWTSYTIMQIVDSAYGGASGLEHQNSHVDVLAPSFVGSEFQPSLYAHEIFHSWNVKRLRPADLWPYRYSQSQPTPWLWVSEGITDYYADLSEVRGGVIDEKGFYALTAEKMNEVMNAVPVSLEDASLNTWVHPVDGTAYIYYPKGSLAGLMLDILIRDGSDGRQSLDDVMRGLYETTYKRGRGFTPAEWWGAVSRAAGEPYRGKLLALPPFLTRAGALSPNASELGQGFDLTGYFLARHVFEPRGIAPPEARASLIALVARSGGGAARA